MKKQKNNIIKITAQDRYYRKTYGITLAEFNEKKKLGCEICGYSLGRLNQDHIHIKGFKKMIPEEKKKYLRGCICFLCNTAIGKLERTNDYNKNLNRLMGIYRYFKTYRIKGI